MKILKILREVYKTTSDLLHVHVHVHGHAHVAGKALARFLPVLQARANERIALGMLPLRLVQMAVIAAVAASSQTEQGGPCAGTPRRMAHTRAPARRPTCALKRRERAAWPP